MEYEKQPDALMKGYVHIKAAPSPQIAEVAELPPPDVIGYTCIGENDAYSPALVKKIVRDAIAASRRAAPTSAGQAGQVAVHQMRQIAGGGWVETDADEETSLKRMPHWKGVFEFRTLYTAPTELAAAQAEQPITNIGPNALPSRTAAEWETMDHAQLGALGNAAAWRQRGE